MATRFAAASANHVAVFSTSLVDIYQLTLRSILKYHFSILGRDNPHLNDTRAFACEVTAWRFVSCLSERETLDCLLTGLPGRKQRPEEAHYAETAQDNGSYHASQIPDEHDPLLLSHNIPQQEGEQNLRLSRQAYSHQSQSDHFTKDGRVSVATFVGLNALEIAVIVGAKKFISQSSVQRIINGIWKGDIVFWESFSVDSKKRPQIYHKRFDGNSVSPNP